MTRAEEFLAREWRAMRRRIVESIGANQAEMTDATLSIPVGLYTDPARFQAEKDILFRQTPLLAGFSMEVAEPGDVMLFDGAGPGIFIVRRQDRSLRAFLNVCPHRGARKFDHGADQIGEIDAALAHDLFGDFRYARLDEFQLFHHRYQRHHDFSDDRNAGLAAGLDRSYINRLLKKHEL